MLKSKFKPMRMLDGGQLGFYFAPACIASANKLRQQRIESIKAARREQRLAARGENAYLFEIMDFPESALTSDDLRMLDAYIAREAAKERANWTPRHEARARGVDIGYQHRLVETSGGLFAGMTVQEVSLSDTDLDHDWDCE